MQCGVIWFVIRFILNGGPAEPEGEDGLIDKILSNHILEGWHDAVDADLWETHAQNTVKLGCYEGDTRLADSLTESLVLHFQSYLSSSSSSFIIII